LRLYVRLALITARYHPLTGGIETHVHEVARRLARRDLDVTVLTTDRSGQLPTVEERDGVVVRRFRAYPKSRDYFYSPGLIREITRGRFDIAHVQGVHTLVCPLALRAAQRVAMPTALTFHTGGHSSRLRRFTRPAQWHLLASSLRKTDRLIAVSQFEANLFSHRLGLGPGRIEVIPNGAEPPEHVGPRTAEIQGDPLVVSVGRLERYKGHQRLIAAMPALVRLAPEARLVIAGSGPHEMALRASIRKHGLDKAVTIQSFGADERPALATLLAASDVVALMSDYEAQPVALLEALALGAKLVVAENSGLAELADRRLATAVRTDEMPSSLARTLLAVANRPQRLPSPVQLPTWDNCAEQLLRAYRELLCES
jgi:glycosyltransferase involved in cell wall biosynthesis